MANDTITGPAFFHALSYGFYLLHSGVLRIHQCFYMSEQSLNF